MAIKVNSEEDLLKLAKMGEKVVRDFESNLKKKMKLLKKEAMQDLKDIYKKHPTLKRMGFLDYSIQDTAESIFL